MLSRITLLAALACSVGTAPSYAAPENQPCKMTQSDVAKYLLHSPAPVCSSRTNVAGPPVEGVFQVDVDRDGKVTSVKIYRSTGTALMDECGLRTLKNWRFRPLPTGCKGVLVHVPFEITRK